jgi:hypothetical protein
MNIATSPSKNTLSGGGSKLFSQSTGFIEQIESNPLYASDQRVAPILKEIRRLVSNKAEAVEKEEYDKVTTIKARVRDIFL